MDLFASHVARKAAIYTQALEIAGFDSAVISAGELVYPFNDDLDYSFRCSAYFSEWLPVQDFPGNYLLFTPGETLRLYLPIIDDYWDSPPAPIPDTVASAFEINWYRDVDDVCRVLSSAGRLAWVGPNTTAVTSKVPLTVNPRGLMHVVDYHRAYKTAYEIRCLEEATRIAHRGHSAAETAFFAGKSELDIHFSYLSAARLADEELPYRSIIALNEHASTLHHMARDKAAPATHFSFLIDAGAQYGGYAADISRTHVAEGDDSDVFRALRDDLNERQQALVAAIRPGQSFPELHDEAHQLVAELLVEHGLVTCSLDEAVAAGVSSVFFPHGLGHLLGIQVHDRGGHLAAIDGTEAPPPAEHPALRFTRTLEADMVFTVEPGLYFIDSLLEGFADQSLLNADLITALKPFGGIRIEDNVVLNATGARNLTREIFQ